MPTAIASELVISKEQGTDEKLDIWMSQIRGATEEADRTHTDAISVQSWESAVNSLKSSLEFARNK